jgi:enoyl-[acyl-carrier protein] reductase I
MRPGYLEGKKVLIMGVANDKSIAWGCAKKMREEGASIAMNYLTPKAKPFVQPLAEQVDTEIFLQCDVTNEEEKQVLVKELENKWGEIDVFIHSMAFAKKEDLNGRVVDTSRDGFMQAMDVSVYSLIDMTRRLLPMLAKAKGNVLAMSYIGATRAIPHYNIMGVAKAALEASVRYLAYDLGKEGIRVNAISSGPISTRAASGILGFDILMDESVKRNPIKKSLTIEDVAGTALYLASDLSSGVTGELIFADNGFHMTAY